MLQRITSNLRTKISAYLTRSTSVESSFETLQKEITRESNALRDMHLSDAKRLQSIERLEAVLKRSSEHDLPELRKLCAQAVLQPLVSSEDKAVLCKAALLIKDSGNHAVEDFLHRVIEMTSNNEKRTLLLNI